jgi:eukaryotic-like serine/threonine-protein kinase
MEQSGRGLRTLGNVRFGDFEVDVRSGELRKGGLRVKLQGRPFQILVLLMERRGELVTRADLRKSLWSSDTYVDFDRSIDIAIYKLRAALNDLADHPRYIETLPRRGYRFIAPIEPTSTAPTSRAEGHTTSTAVAASTTALAEKQAAPDQTEQSRPVPTREEVKPADSPHPSPVLVTASPGPVSETAPSVSSAPAIDREGDAATQDSTQVADAVQSGVPRVAVFDRWSGILRAPIYLGLAALAFVAVAALVYARIVHRAARSAVKPPPSVAVIGFKNVSGRPETAWLSTALSEMLSTELASDHKLLGIPEETVVGMKHDLALPDSDSFSPETLTRIRVRLGADFVVVGSYLDLGGRAKGNVRLDFRLQNAVTGETVEWVTVNGNEQEIPELAVRTGMRLRAKLGAGELTAAETEKVRASLPSNAEAARLYSEGLNRLRTFDVLAARGLLEKAVAADPQHALSHAALAEAWSALGYDAKAQEEAKKAFELSGALVREDQLFVQARYFEISCQWYRALETYRVLSEFFPDSVEYGMRLANSQIAAGKARAALGTLEKLRALPSPAKKDPRLALVEARAAESLSDLKHQQRAAAQAVAEGLAQGYTLVIAEGLLSEARALSALGETARAAAAYKYAETEYAAAGDKSGATRAMSGAARIRLMSGDMEGARSVWRRALAIYEELGNQQGVAGDLDCLGVVSYWAGDISGSKLLYERSLAVYTTIGNRRGTAHELSNIADAMSTLGEFEGALANWQKAIAIERELGNKRALARNLHDVGDALLAEGELSEAEKRYAEETVIWQETGDRDGYSDALYGLATVLWAKGDLEGAQQKMMEDRRIKAEISEQTYADNSTVNLARLAIDRGKPQEAEQLAREALESFRRQKNSDMQATALEVLARAHLAQGKVADAEKAVNEALALTGKTQVFYVLQRLGITAALVRAASGRRADVNEALKSLEAVLSQAKKTGFVASQFEARLAMGEIGMKSGSEGVSRAGLDALERDAKAKGFGLIARQAAQSSLYAAVNVPVQ